MHFSLYVPYVVLGLLVPGLLVIRSVCIIRILTAVSMIAAFAAGIIDILGLGLVCFFWGICELYWRNLSSRVWINFVNLFVIVVIAIGFASHLMPGFHNVRIFDAINISASSQPFTMYLNFDKTITAIILALSSGMLVRQTGSSGTKFVGQTATIAALCILLLIPLAVFSGYVNFDPKFPDTLYLWAFNNLIFVCFAEEVLFRGVIQKQLLQVASQWNITPIVSIVIAALLFGLAHFQGGMTYVGFAALAGLFYGYAYHKTGRLESAMLVHFLVNLVHFLFFSYPAAIVTN